MAPEFTDFWDSAVAMSKNVQELREALERQTKDGLKLHEETTKFPAESAIPSLSREESSPSGSVPSVGATSPFLGSQNVLASSVSGTVIENSASSSAGGSPPNSVFCSKYKIHTDSEKKNEEQLENILEEYSQKGRDVQKRLNETAELHEQQKIDLRLIIADLEAKLMQVQLARDVLQDSRQKESQRQENVKIQLENTIQELETANQWREEMLREADSQTEHLKEMLHGHEQVLLELRDILMDYEGSTGKKFCEHERVSSLRIRNLNTAFANVLRDLDSEVLYVKEKVVLVEGELESLKKDSETQKQLLLQQHQNREHTRNQISVHGHQASHLESAVSQLRSELQEAKRMYEDKVEDLEKQLHLARSEITEARTERDERNQESGELNDQIHQLLTQLRKKEIELSLEKEQNKRFWARNTDDSITIDHLRRELEDKTAQLQRMENTVKEMRAERRRQMECQMAATEAKNESVGRISSSTVRLESPREALRKVQQDFRAKQIDLESAEKTVSNLAASLRENERALEVPSKEIKQVHSQLRGGMQLKIQHLRNEEGCFHSVRSECETLKLQVLEKEKVIEIFQKQVDNMTQMVDQYSRTAGAMEVEKSRLIKERNDSKLQVQEMKIAMDEKEARIQEMGARLSELELEKVELVNTCTERLHALNDVKQEKDQLMNELQASRSELAGLAGGFEDLKRDYKDKMEEMENTAKRLKKQLKSAQADLERMRSALKTMEGSDCNAVKVAVGMQKQITAKRGQIDALQSKIKFLEEAMTSAAKEKHYLREENSKLSQALSCITAENTKIVGELEILRSQDKRLKEKISQMETALDKASVQFAECQCIIQCQEQEAMRTRLQHTLDVKMPSKPDILKKESLQDLKSSLQELTSLDSDICSVDLGKDDSNGGRKSPLATVRNKAETAARASATETVVEKDTFGRDPLCLHTAELQSQDVTLPFASLGGASVSSAAPHHTSSPKKVSLKERYRERSPVHLLLTAPPDDLAAGLIASPGHARAARKVGSPEGAATGTPITCQPMKTSEKTPRRLQNKMESLQNLVESLQIKNRATSSTIRTQERKKEKAKEKKLSKCRRRVC